MLYNGMIAPLVPYAMKGAIWYQGETNAWNPEPYKTLFSLLIKNWRSDWQNEFPFYFTQLAPYTYNGSMQSQRLREAQMQTLSVPKTGMAVTLDIGTAITVHPSNKVDVGERLARWALAKDYKKKISYSGPIYKSFKIKNNAVILSFDYSDGLKLKVNNSKTYFQISGEDSVFKPATVSVKRTSLVVTSPEVKKPIAVRYAWDNVVEATLFNRAGLPASSFRTDNWSK
jgi:sialate O-acetylesterase